MGKATRKKQKELNKREENVRLALVAHRDSGKHARGVINAGTKGIMTNHLASLHPFFIRELKDWTYKGKSKRIEKDSKGNHRWRW